MSNEDGGPAFPACNEANVNGTMGMSLRDHFAGQAMASLLASTEPNSLGVSYDTFVKVTAESAYQYADAMLAARKREVDTHDR